MDDMNSMNSIVNAVSRITFLLLSALLLGWALLPEYRPIFVGWILGLTVGLINVRYLSAKVGKLIHLVANQESSRRYSFGFLTRICLILCAIMVAAKFDQVSMTSTIAGLFIPQVLTIPASIMVVLRDRS